MHMMSVFTSFGGLEKTGGFAQTIMMSNIAKVDDPYHGADSADHHLVPGCEACGADGRRCNI